MSSKKDNKGRVLHRNEDQLKNGRYRFRYIDRYGERRAVYSWKLVKTDKIPKGKKEDLSLREKEKNIQRDFDENINTYAANSTVNDLMQNYFACKVRLANSTIENYKHMWEKNIKNVWLGRMRIGDVKKSDILRYYAYLYNDRKFAVGTIQLYQNILFPAFQMAVDDSIIRLNPCRNCMKNYVRGSMTSNRNALTKEEQDNLLEFLHFHSCYYGKYYALIALMIGTGLRIGEALGLTWDDIDFYQRQINVNHQIIYKKVNGKFQQYITEPKTKTSRIVPLQEKVLAIMSEYKNNNYFASLASGFEVDGYKNFVFICSNGSVYRPNVIVRACHGMRDEYNRMETEAACEENREPQLLSDFSPHVLRHTFCTRMAENGIDVKVLQEIMGHKNINVTMQVYNHVNGNRVQKEVARIADII